MKTELAAIDERLKRYLEQNASVLIEDWAALVRQPSISRTGEGLEECCDAVLARMRAVGLEAVKHPIKPYPLLEGRLGHDPAKRTVLIYGHYDVQPVEPLSAWQYPPFSATIIDGVMYGRGSADNKAPLCAHLAAVDFFVREYGEAPCNLIFLFEGCEENGSKGLADFLRENKERLAADLVFLSDGPKDPGGSPIIALGAKGSLSVRFKAHVMKRDVHSRYAPVLPNAALRLVELLTKLYHDGQVDIPGFYDGILPTTPAEAALLAEIPDISAAFAEDNGITIPYNRAEFYERLINRPTFNISLLAAGTGAAITPAHAEAGVDMRLVKGQEPERIYRLLCERVAELGYPDVTVEKRGAVPPSKTDVSTPWLSAVRRATERVFGEYVLYPCRPSTAPDYVWTDILGLPTIQVRCSDEDSNNHTPYERQKLAGFLQSIELTVNIAAEVARAH